MVKRLIYIYRWKKYRIEPDAVTIASVLPACGDPLALSLGRQMHEYVEMKKLRPNLLLENSLVDMYAKCGSLQDAREVFDRTKFHDVVSQTSMISAFGLNGQGCDAVVLFVKMRDLKQSRFDCLCFGYLWLQPCRTIGEGTILLQIDD